ncbi:hypothetical protein Q73A0000_09410 [Kaistella flava (ex Peng et al. 2021)]|uniref:Signal peptidase n=1 Tax=Kaistella flava (ex Peng et al. 2021) TaxID=2038776 RepID=A0A7M2YAI0_9FLAO|nr:hypothetical protein [Kaistella flava (ex Peng et al. 2021)]QOW10574.1 hypothetical protein Q73A0000_09410 [Kaistella flava (ex Peng et al. 2021)]
MKNVLFLFLFLIGGALQAETPQEDNPFATTENTNRASLEANENVAARGPGAPPGGSKEDDAALLPIDDYIPLLVITALGIIIYTTQKKRNLVS